MVPSHLQTEYRAQTKSLILLHVSIGMSQYKVTYELNYTALVSVVINILYFVNIVFFFLLFKNRVNCWVSLNYFLTTWIGGHVDGQNNKYFFAEFSWKKSSSQWRNIVLFLSTSIAEVAWATENQTSNTSFIMNTIEKVINCSTFVDLHMLSSCSTKHLILKRAP